MDLQRSFVEEVADDNRLRAFTFFSANLQKLCPDLLYEQHRSLFLQANRYADLTLDDERNIRWANTLEPPAGLLDGMDRPGIIASFHTGPYRLLCMWLAKQGVPITMVISADVAMRQEQRNRKAYGQVAGGDASAGYEYLYADDPMVLRKMIHALKRGRFLVCYIDGNMGVGKNTQSRNTLTLDFMAHQLRVRTGVAELARIAGVPIYPVMTHFDDHNRPAFQRFGTIDPQAAGNGGKAAVAGWMEQLYGHLGTEVRQHLPQWEGWFYIHHDFVRHKTDIYGGLLRYYLPFKMGGRHFLLNKESYNAQPVTEEVYLLMKAHV